MSEHMELESLNIFHSKGYITMRTIVMAGMNDDTMLSKAVFLRKLSWTKVARDQIFFIFTLFPFSFFANHRSWFFEIGFEGFGKFVFV